MKRLFENEEKEAKINQLKVDLIGCFYPFTREELIRYQAVLKFDYLQLMNNNFIDWDLQLIIELADRIDWKALYKIKNSSFDYAFFQKLENRIDFNTIHYSKNIKWTDKLLEDFGDKFDWSASLITKQPLSTLANLRRFKKKVNWGFVSEHIQLEFNESIIKEFDADWDWKRLSANTNLPATIDFIEKHSHQLDFEKVSQNPKMLNLICQNSDYPNWKWEKVILNPGIVYNKQTFTLIFNNYKKDFETKEFTHSQQKNMALHTFLFRVFSHQYNDINYLLSDDFINYLPWEILCTYCRTELSLSFIEQYKGKLNFTEPAFLRTHKNVLTYEFLKANVGLFNFEHPSFYELPISIELLSNYENKINWNSLSACEKLDWNWEFITSHLEKFNPHRLASNKGIFEKLMLNKLTRIQIDELLNKELLKNKN